MRRVLLVLIAVVEIVAPGRIVAWGERRAFENSDAGNRRPWTLPMARLEGLAALWLVWNWESAWPGVEPPFGPFPRSPSKSYPLTAEVPARTDRAALEAAADGVARLVETNPDTKFALGHRG